VRDDPGDLAFVQSDLGAQSTVDQLAGLVRRFGAEGGGEEVRGPLHAQEGELEDAGPLDCGDWGVGVGRLGVWDV